MNSLRVAAVALNQTPLAWDANAENILNGVRKARDEGASVVCLPELCVTGYGCEDAFFSPDVQQMAVTMLMQLLPEFADCVVALGLPIRHRGQLYNAAGLVVNGRLLGFGLKQNLAGDGIHYEPRWFRAWPANSADEITLGEDRYPVGDLLFDCGGVRIGFEICRDAWVADRPAANLAARGADLILNPSASHFAFGKQDVRRDFARAAGKFHVGFIYANLLGNEAGRAIYDGGTLIANQGVIVASGDRFSYRDVEITVAEIDIAGNRRNLAASQARFADSLTSSDRIVCCDYEYPARNVTTPSRDATDSVPDKLHEFAQAVSLGLFDYLRKSRAQAFVVSTSGGADSTAVATLVFLMVRFASEQLGVDGVRNKLVDNPRIRDCADARSLVKALLTCVYQSTRHSSRATFDAAQSIAEAIGAEFIYWSVDSIVDEYESLVSEAIGRELTWDRDDVARQNIQARARGPGVWMLANLRSALLLATSNRSEAAVGYATMDGDTCGGLAPIAGIDKAFLRQWLRWLETQGPTATGPLAALAGVNAQQPTAELRPVAAQQRDEADLMPYDVLDAIERVAIRDRRTPVAVWRTVSQQFPAYSPQQIGDWVTRFFRLWCQNQWKRERYAPSFHLDDENLDPKTWCRFPILSGGYQRELADLRTELDNCSKRSDRIRR